MLLLFERMVESVLLRGMTVSPCRVICVGFIFGCLINAVHLSRDGYDALHASKEAERPAPFPDAYWMKRYEFWLKWLMWKSGVSYCWDLVHGVDSSGSNCFIKKNKIKKKLSWENKVNSFLALSPIFFFPSLEVLGHSGIVLMQLSRASFHGRVQVNSVGRISCWNSVATQHPQMCYLPGHHFPLWVTFYFFTPGVWRPVLTLPTA